MKHFFILLVCASLVISCKKDESVEKSVAKEITLSQNTDLQMQIGEKQEVTISGGDGKNYEVSSSNNSVAKTSLKNNLVTIEAKSEGESVVTINSAGKSKKIAVKVSVPKLMLSETSLEMTIGDTKNISVTGENVKDFQVSASPSSVVEIVKKDNKSFSVEAKKEGETTITVTSAGATKELKIKVLPKEILIKSISFDKNQQSLGVGKSSKLIPIIEPANATNQKFVWESNDPKVIRVNKDNGEIFASPTYVGKSAIITAIAQDGSDVKGQIEVRATQLVQSVKITLGDKEVAVGAEFQLAVEVLPTTASSLVEWKSDDTSVAEVNNEGKVKALKEGKATITATSTDGSTASGSVEIKVITEVDKIVVTQSTDNNIKVKAGTKTPLTFNLFYNNNAKGKIDSKDPRKKFLKFYDNGDGKKTAYINDKMELIAIKSGTATITISYQDERSENLETKLQVTVE